MRIRRVENVFQTDMRHFFGRSKEGNGVLLTRRDGETDEFKQELKAAYRELLARESQANK